MEKTYKITGEIERVLRHLEEVCVEQRISMQDALEWYLTNKIQPDSEEPVHRKEQELSYEERVEKFVSEYVDGEKKNICVFVICLFKNYKRKWGPSNKVIFQEIKKAEHIVHKSESYVRKAIVEFLVKSTEGRFVDDGDWLRAKRQLYWLAEYFYK